MVRDFLLGREDGQTDAMDREMEGRKQGRKEGKFSCTSFQDKY